MTGDASGRRRIAVVGGGPSGVLVAVNLIGRFVGPAEILLIEKSGEFGPGVPYRTTNPEHRLNVPAARMSVVPDDPDHFLDWLRRHDPDASGSTYASRGIYGRYMSEYLADAENGLGAQDVRLIRVEGEAVDAEVTAQTATVKLRDGRILDADHIVVAVGPVPGADPVPVPEPLRSGGVYIPSGWDESAVAPALEDRTVLIIGTGLTMIDVAITLGSAADGPSIRAVSRNGLVPRRHLAGLTRLSTPVLPEGEDLGIRDLFGVFTDELARATLEGGNWRDTIDSMRSVTPAAWRRLPVGERRWFIETINRAWDVHRYRMAPAVADRFEELSASGRVTVSAGRIESLTPSGTGARATLLTENGAEVAEFDRVINASGAGTSVRDNAPPLVKKLISSGAVRPDDLELGLDVTPLGEALDHDGVPSNRVSVIGSLRRGVEWESIGVPELKQQATTIANRLATPTPQPKNPARSSPN